MSDRLNNTVLPGFGRPLDDYPSAFESKETRIRPRFPHAIADGIIHQPISRREFRMLLFINQITDKPEWERKVFDDAIVERWRREAVAWHDASNDFFMTSACFDYCMEELRDKVDFYRTSKMVFVLDSTLTIVKSDTAVSTQLKKSLQDYARGLEKVPENKKDWHPGSDGKVLDLLHPSLFPLIHGVSRVLPSGNIPIDSCLLVSGMGEIVNPEFSGVDTVNYGDRHNEATLRPWGSFQWLPSNLEFTAGQPKLTSCVNNLHPVAHRSLYGVLEDFVDAAIPLWNECLSWFDHHERIEDIIRSDCDYFVPDECRFDLPILDDNGVLLENNTRKLKYQDAKDTVDYWEHHPPDDFDDDLKWTLRDWFEKHRILKETSPLPFSTRHIRAKNMLHRPTDLKKDFDGIQVIFKLANIHLTPELLEYEGGSWHVEGALNEHICASALYYYDEENVSPSHLAFRQSLDAWKMQNSPARVSYPQAVRLSSVRISLAEKNCRLTFVHEFLKYEWGSTAEFFGIEDSGPTVQDLGSILTRPGRLLAFPNVLQHQVQPFKLQDPSKPGHRKILAMFLVDPNIRILSTANVPPQRRDWWAEELSKIPWFQSLPREIFCMILHHVDFPLSWEDALEARQNLMKERGGFNEEFNDHLDQTGFYFCEH